MILHSILEPKMVYRDFFFTTFVYTGCFNTCVKNCPSHEKSEPRLFLFSFPWLLVNMPIVYHASWPVAASRTSSPNSPLSLAQLSSLFFLKHTQPLAHSLRGFPGEVLISFWVLQGIFGSPPLWDHSSLPPPSSPACTLSLSAYACVQSCPWG